MQSKNGTFCLLLPSSSTTSRMWHKAIFTRGIAGLSSLLSFSLTIFRSKCKEHGLLYYLPIAGGRIVGFMPLPRILEQRQTQTALSRIRTRVTDFISFDGNHCTKHASKSANRSVVPCLPAAEVALNNHMTCNKTFFANRNAYFFYPIRSI